MVQTNTANDKNTVDEKTGAYFYSTMKDKNKHCQRMDDKEHWHQTSKDRTDKQRTKMVTNNKH